MMKIKTSLPLFFFTLILSVALTASSLSARVNDDFFPQLPQSPSQSHHRAPEVSEANKANEANELNKIYSHQKIFLQDYDTVWNATLQEITRIHHFEIMIANKEKGRIITRWIDQTNEMEFFYRDLQSLNLYQFQLFIEISPGKWKNEQATKVKIIKKQKVKSHSPITEECKKILTQPVIEKTLFYRLNHLLKRESQLNKKPYQKAL